MNTHPETGETSDQVAEGGSPSGPPFQPPLDLSYEASLIFSRMLDAVYRSLHPLNVLVAAVALSLTSWLAFGLEQWPPTPPPSEVLAEGETDPILPRPLSLPAGTTAQWWQPASRGLLVSPLEVAGELLSPWAACLSAKGWRFLVGGLSCLVMLAVWSWAGTFICRGVATRMLTNSSGWADICQFTNRHFVDAFCSIGIPLVAAAGLAIPLAMAGVLLIGDWTSVLGSLLAALLAILALPMALILLGLALSWPLMFPAIALEGRDSFESISRAYAYVLQRPLHLVAVIAVAVVFGWAIGWIVVQFFELAWASFQWSLAWGGNLLATDRLDQLVDPDPQTTSAVIRFGTYPLLNGVREIFHVLARATVYSIFWGLATATYLLMRRYLDQTPLDEIYQPGPSKLADLVS